MVDFKTSSWEIENLKYSHPYVAQIHFSARSADVDQLHYLLEHEYVFKRMGHGFYFETEQERNSFLNRVNKQYD